MTSLRSLHLRFNLKGSDRISGKLTKKALDLETAAINSLFPIIMRITPALNLLAIQCVELPMASAIGRNQTQGSSHTVESVSYIQACTELDKPWAGWHYHNI